MMYQIKLKKRAIKDLKGIPPADRKRIIERIEGLENNLQGDVKQLTNFTPEFRLRSGQWRVLFEVEGTQVIVYRVLHRRESYR